MSNPSIRNTLKIIWFRVDKSNPIQCYPALTTACYSLGRFHLDNILYADSWHKIDWVWSPYADEGVNSFWCHGIIAQWLTAHISYLIVSSSIPPAGNCFSSDWIGLVQIWSYPTYTHPIPAPSNLRWIQSQVPYFKVGINLPNWSSWLPDAMSPKSSSRGLPILAGVYHLKCFSWRPGSAKN